MATRIDHFMYAVASLDDGMRWAEEQFGVAPAYGGEHVGLGTHNALLSLGSAYLEIIAPDPAQDQTGTLGERFAQLPEGGLVTWAAEGNLKEIAAALATCNVDTAGPSRTERLTSTGDKLVWELLFPVGSAHGPRMPFFIDWLDCANPKDTNPVGGEFVKLTITTPEAESLSNTLQAVGLKIEVEAGDPGIAVAIDVGGNMVELTTTAATSRITMR